MVFRKMVYIYWTPSRVHQTMYKSGTRYISNVIYMTETVIRLSDLPMVVVSIFHHWCFSIDPIPVRQPVLSVYAIHLLDKGKYI
jgi:hypothetical protein